MNKANISTKELVMTAVLMALAVVLYMVDKSITLPFKWLTSLIYFLPVIVLAVFMRKTLFFCGVIVLSVTMFIIGTGAISLFDFVLEYVIPLLSIASFLIINKYQSYKSLVRVYIALAMTLSTTFVMYVIAGMILYGVTLQVSISVNAPNIILPIIVLGVLVMPTLEIMNKLIK